MNNYSVCLLKYYFFFIDFKDAVKEGNVARLVTLHKELLSHFKALPGFDNYAIKMLISIVQNYGSCQRPRLTSASGHPQ